MNLQTSLCRVLLVSLFMMHCGTDIAGNSSEVGNPTVTGRLYMPDGVTPAPAAKVQFIEINYVNTSATDTGNAMYPTVFTDDNGIFHAPKSLQGTYNILAKQDDNRAFIDSVVLDGKSRTLPAETLKPAGSLTGKVTVQVQHNPQIASIAVLGTLSRVNAGPDGFFSIQDIAEGRYTLAISAQADGYITTYFRFVIVSGQNDTLQNYLPVIYTGIPVIENIAAIYNPDLDAVELSWDSTRYMGFDNYSIYRSAYPDVKSFTYLDETKTCTWVDMLTSTTFDSIPEGIDSLQLRYRVYLESKSGKQGESYGYVSVQVPIESVGKSREPEIVLTMENALQRTKPFVISASMVNPPPDTAGLQWGWCIGFTDDTIYTTTSLATIHADSVVESYPVTVLAVRDDSLSGKKVLASYTTTLPVYHYWEKIAEPFEVTAVAYALFIFGNTLHAITSLPAGNNVVNQLWKMNDDGVWSKTSDSLPIMPRVIKQVYRTENQVWVIGGKTLSAVNGTTSIYPKDFWKTADFQTWDSIGSFAELDSFTTIVPYIFNNELFVFGISPAKIHIQYQGLWKVTSGFELQNIPHSPVYFGTYKNELYPVQIGQDVFVTGFPMQGHLQQIKSNDWNAGWESVFIDSDRIGNPAPGEKVVSFKDNAIVIVDGQLGTENYNLMLDYEIATGKQTILAIDCLDSGLNGGLHDVIEFNHQLYTIGRSGVWVLR